MIDVFDNTSQSIDYVGLEDDWMPAGSALKAWHGYGLTMYEGNRALIMP